MNKKTLILSLCLCSILMLSANGQFSLAFGSDSADGLETRFSSYLLHYSGNWSLLNTTKIKYSEFQDNIGSYYQENYIRNLLAGSYTQQNWSLDFSFGLGISPDENHPLQPEGVNGFIEQQCSYSLGGGFKYDNDKLYFELDLDYYAARFDKYNLGLNNSEPISENDLTASLKSGYYIFPDLLIYLGTDHFNDLNDNEIMNYSDYHLTGEYTKRLNYIHFLDQDISLGYSDLDEVIPYYVLTRTRLSSRFTPDWTLLNVLEYQGWLDEQNEIYLGNSWFKTTIRRNLGISAGNELSYLQAAAQYELDTEIGYAQLSGRYYMNSLMLAASGKNYFGNNRWLDQQLNAGLAWSFVELDLSLNYAFELTLGAGEDESTLHTIYLEFTF
ncbi:MAG: hypothetical protein K9N06_03565 [Candidatus Cloacimonetes bacterium]|nr:hypothetical protein [Candidatus Cloacimonadota bacterium]